MLEVSANSVKGLLKDTPASIVFGVSCGMIMLLMVLCTLNSASGSGGQGGNKDKVEQGIKKLWSADDDTRLLGREELLRIGAPATEPVRNLLTELIRDRRPRFATETASEGRKALDAFLNRVRSGEYPGENDPQRATVSRLAVNSRLMDDATWLLGELRALEGVPVLIRLMERGTASGPVPIGPELRALAKIGSPAVPFLLNSIKTAEMTAGRVIHQRSITFVYILSPDPDDFIDDEYVFIDHEEKDGTDTQDLEVEEKWELERRTLLIKRRAIWVLTEIGDTSVLPFLEALAKEEASKKTSIAEDVIAAIAEIKNEDVSGPEPDRRPRPPR